MFCDYSLWHKNVYGERVYICANPDIIISSAGRVDNPNTHLYDSQDDEWKMAGVVAYDQQYHGGPITFTNVADDGTCIGFPRLLAVDK